MSWLLMAGTPVLLMLAATGLDRIETGLRGVGTVSYESVGSPDSAG